MDPDWFVFLGRFHPLIVHLPIGIIMFLILLKAIVVFKKYRLPKLAIRLALFVGSISTVFAVITGHFLSQTGAYDRETVFWHKWIGITLAIVLCVASIMEIKQQWDVRVIRISASNWLLFLAVLLILTGGHLGGNMTHGNGYLTRHMPPLLKQLFAVAPPPAIADTSLPAHTDSVNVFTHIIQPMLNTKCVQCHNPVKASGGLVLSSAEGILKGGKMGNTIVRGEWQTSELLRRVSLPQTSSRFMPPDNHVPLVAVEKSILRWWLSTGADFKKNIHELGAGESVRFLVTAYLGYNMENSTDIALPQVAAADPKMLQALRDSGLVIQPLHSESNLLDVSFVMLEKQSTAQLLPVLRKLLTIREQLYHLNIKKCALGREATEIIAEFTMLDKLNVQQCGLSDHTAEPLRKLKKLSTLNIGRNPLTDKSFEVLSHMQGLKKLNLWQTNISEAALKNFSASRIELVTIWK
jgi:uncharacterized membrane protein